MEKQEILIIRVEYHSQITEQKNFLIMMNKIKEMIKRKKDQKKTPNMKT
jgi:hypothetical protein